MSTNTISPIPPERLSLPNMSYTFTGKLQRNSRSGYLRAKYAPLHNLVQNSSLKDFDTKKLAFDLDHPVSILTQESFDGSVNLILNDDFNRPRLINTRFATAENDTFIVPDHYGNKDTTLYDEDSLDIDTSLYKTISKIPTLKFDGLQSGGSMKAGAYHFYFKLADNDDNETDFILESSVVQCHIGEINKPESIRMGMENENTKKAIRFSFGDLDNSYDFIKVYYTRSTSGQEGTDVVTAHKIQEKYPILSGDNLAKLVIFGTETVEDIAIQDINPIFEYVDYVKSATICQNRLFFGNISKPVIPYEDLKEFSLRITPSLSQKESIGAIDDNYNDWGAGEDNEQGYYNAKNIYYRVGLWPGEYYRYGIVYLMNDFTLSPVFNTRGLDFDYVKEPNRIQQHPKGAINFDSEGYIIDSETRENIHGLIKVKQDIDLQSDGARPIGVQFKYDDPNTDLQNRIEKQIKGFFIVRQARIPITLAQGINIGKTKNHYGNLPCLKIRDKFRTDSFLRKTPYGINILSRELINIKDEHVENKAAIVPDAVLRSPLFNQIFVSTDFKYKVVSKVSNFKWASTLRCIPSDYVSAPGSVQATKFTMVNTGISETTNGEDFFSAKAGEAEITSTFSSVSNDWTSQGAEKSTALVTNSLTKEKIADYLATDLMQDQVVRGLYGTYVGLGENDLQFGDIFNIMDPSYDDGVEYKKQAEYIRITANGPYYAASERFPIDKLFPTSQTDLEQGVVCYRGDCFIGNYTHRMVRNFIDPELPTNEKVMEPTGWSDNFAVLTKFQADVDGKTEYINEVVPIFKAKMINDGENHTDWDNYLKTVLAPGKTWDEDLSGKLALSDGEPINWSKDNAKMMLPDDSKYAKLGTAGETFGVPNTWYERGVDKINRSDVNSVGLGHWVTFRILSNHNICMRDIDIMETKEKAIFNKERSFFPLQKVSLANQNKLAESNKINGASNKILSERWNFISMDVPYNKQQFDTRIMFSDLTTSDAYKNGFRVFTGLNYKDYPTTYGALTAIKEFNGSIIAVMEHGVLLIPINERTMAGSGAGGAVYTNTSTTLPSNPRVISQTYGSSWKESVYATEQFIYGIDTFGKKIWRTNGEQLEILSDFKLQKFLNDNINLKEWDKFVKIGFRNVKVHYNEFKKDVMFVFYNEDKSWNLCYNEYLKIFTTFYSWTPSYSENINNIFISLDLEDTKSIIAINSKNLNSQFNESKYTPIIPKTITGDEIILEVGEATEELIIYEESQYPDNKYFILHREDEDDPYTLKYNTEYSNEIETKNHLTATLLYGGEKVKVRVASEDSVYNKIWKHGQAGVFDQQGKIKPTNWYGKQEGFELEIVVAHNAVLQKVFSTILLISNKAAPKEFTFEVVGESYNWFNFKDIIQWINTNSPTEAMRQDLYILVLKSTQSEMQAMFPDFPVLPNKPDNYIIRKLPYLRRIRKTKSGTYLDNQFELNSTEVKLVEDDLLSEQRIQVSQNGNDISKVGRIAGNMQYLEDCWNIEIRHLNFKNASIDYKGRLVFSKETASRIRDKYCKIRIKYSGEDLVVLQGIKTLFNYSYA